MADGVGLGLDKVFVLIGLVVDGLRHLVNTVLVHSRGPLSMRLLLVFDVLLGVYNVFVHAEVRHLVVNGVAQFGFPLGLATGVC